MLIEGFFNKCFKKNQSRGREGKPPVNFTECTDIASRVMAANKVRGETVVRLKTYNLFPGHYFLELLFGGPIHRFQVG
jgi:hypothetical protein